MRSPVRSDDILIRGLDVTLAAGLLLFLAPTFALAAALLWLFEGPPVIQRDGYLGADGRSVFLLSFRARPGGPIGSFLIRSRLQRLPCLWNILRGELRWIGPPPVRAHGAAPLQVHAPARPGLVWPPNWPRDENLTVSRYLRALRLAAAEILVDAA